MDHQNDDNGVIRYEATPIFIPIYYISMAIAVLYLVYVIFLGNDLH